MGHRLAAAAEAMVGGAHGRSGLTHVLLGSVAEGVIRTAHRDVLVARAAGLPFKLPWGAAVITLESSALLTDLYQRTLLHTYFRHSMDAPAVRS